MKKTQEILGLPIISISDGMEAGKVKSVIINSEKGAIDYIAVESGVQVFGARVIPAEAVLGIGEYALTIEDANVITDINKIPEAIDLLQKDVRVSGTGVLTKKGRLIGEIGDLFVDEDNKCIISGLEFIDNKSQKNNRLIPRDSVITFGKKLTVVKEDVENTLLEAPEQLYSMGDGKTLEEAADREVDENAEARSTTEDSEGNAAMLFEQKQRQYLLGRKATRTITDNSGNIIITEDDVIDDNIIDNAKAKGKLVELVMNNRT